MSEYDSDLPLIGYRRFRILGPQWGIPEYSLVGSHRSAPWPPKEPMVAKCLPYMQIDDCVDGPIAQSKHCKCGLHLFFTLEDAISYNFTNGPRGFTIGMAAGGGRVLFDKRYARCSVAEVVCLIDPVHFLPALSEHRLIPRFDWLRQWTLGAAEKYGVPMLSHYDAVAYASEFGVFVSGVRDDGSKMIVEGLDDY